MKPLSTSFKRTRNEIDTVLDQIKPLKPVELVTLALGILEYTYENYEKDLFTKKGVPMDFPNYVKFHIEMMLSSMSDIDSYPNSDPIN